MKAINKNENLKKKQYIIKDQISCFTDRKNFLKEILIEKEIGLMGNKCRFIVKLINLFQTEVLK
jgi:hypothetical protein